MTSPTLGPFTLTEPLAHGGMGEVWHATHQRGEAVAIKVLRERDAEAAAALAQEIRSVAALDHPNIVWVHDHGEVDDAAEQASGGRLVSGSPWLAMELCDAGDLRTHARAMDWSAVRDMLIALLDALAHAHARGVVHRDLKPANVLYRHEPGRVPVLKLSDFGLALAVETGRAAVERGGTPTWMAPEQLEVSTVEVGPWTDLYALGAMTWALVTGRAPYGGDTAREVALGHLQQPLPRYQPRLPVPDGLEDWLRQLLTKAPAARPQRAADAAWTLSQLPAPREVGAPAPSGIADSERPTVVLTGPTLVAEAPTALWLPDLHGPARSRPQPAAGIVAPPAPPDWRRAAPLLRTIQEVGTGLRLFGLRALPVVGRAAARDQLWQTLRDTTSDGEVRCVILDGPAGIGKSHLAQWLLRRGHEVGATASFVATHSPEGAAGDGLAGLVARTLRVVGRDPEDARERARRTVPEGLAPELGELLDLVAEGSAPDGTLDRVARLIRHSARGRVALIWLDDVQWGTEALALARALLTGRSSSFPAVLVLTVRTEALAHLDREEEALRGLSTHAHTQRLTLAPLARQHRSELVRTLLRLEPSLAGAVEERSAGHPLFAVQLVTGWVERGELVPGPAGLALRPGADASLPASVGAMWRERLAPVLADDPGARDGLEVAAVLGQEVDATEWIEACQVAGVRTPTTLPVQLAVRRLAALDPGAGGLRWRFVHGMLREALLADAQAAGRAARWHAACAEVVQRRGGAAERLGLHLLAAGRAEEALEPLGRASRAADRAGAWTRNLWLISKRLQAAHAVPDLPDYVVPRIRLDASWSLKNVGRMEDAELEARVVGDAARQAGNRGVEAYALDTLAVVLTERGDLSGAILAAEGAAEAAREVGDDDTLLRALSRLGPALGKSGRIAEARVAYQEVLDRSQAGQQPGQRGAAWFGLAMCAQHQERWDDATRAATIGRAEADAEGWPLLVGDFERLLGTIAGGAGRWDDAERHYRRSLTLYEAGGSPFRCLSHGGLARCALERGDLDAAEQGYQHGLDIARERQRPAWVQSALIGLIDVATRASRFSRLAGLLDELAVVLRQEAYRNQAETLLGAGDRASAAGRAELAVAAWRLAERMLTLIDEDPSPARERLSRPQAPSQDD